MYTNELYRFGLEKYRLEIPQHLIYATTTFLHGGDIDFVPFYTFFPFTLKHIRRALRFWDTASICIVNSSVALLFLIISEHCSVFLTAGLLAAGRLACTNWNGNQSINNHIILKADLIARSVRCVIYIAVVYLDLIGYALSHQRFSITSCAFLARRNER
jgi:hypothetical protein